MFANVIDRFCKKKPFVQQVYRKYQKITERVTRSNHTNMQTVVHVLPKLDKLIKNSDELEPKIPKEP